jgi:hypothetical protein
MISRMRGMIVMTERVMTIDALQAFIVNTFHTEHVRVRKNGDSLVLFPVRNLDASVEIAVCNNSNLATEINREREAYSCPLLGVGIESELTVEKFLEMTREDRENEN